MARCVWRCGRWGAPWSRSTASPTRSACWSSSATPPPPASCATPSTSTRSAGIGGGGSRDHSAHLSLVQGLNLKQQLGQKLQQVLLIGQDTQGDTAADVVTVESLMEAENVAKAAAPKFDWDKIPICLMFTTRNGESKIIKHTNKSLTAQVFSPKGTSNNWFDQV